MKKIFTLAVTLVMAFLASAQMPQTLPLDPKVKTGKLDNGLTYYVVKNSEPKGQADFYTFKKSDQFSKKKIKEVLLIFWKYAFNGSKNFLGTVSFLTLKK
jgi:zinc protease